MHKTHTPTHGNAHPDKSRPKGNAHAARSNPRRIVRNFVIGLTIYFLLIAGYVFALRWLREPLLKLYDHRMTVYALIGLALIIAQGIILESITNFLVEHVGMVTREES